MCLLVRVHRNTIHAPISLHFARRIALFSARCRSSLFLLLLSFDRGAYKSATFISFLFFLYISIAITNHSNCYSTYVPFISIVVHNFFSPHPFGNSAFFHFGLSWMLFEVDAVLVSFSLSLALCVNFWNAKLQSNQTKPPTTYYYTFYGDECNKLPITVGMCYAAAAVRVLLWLQLYSLVWRIECELFVRHHV